ncbi:hypothetical protein FSP39_008322 [Pinctada imbricata]|uniref:Uncharacterized protein n=1 Tax=Pinctada imbricata TaxID=66713 RepID=A0AA89BJ21_PINIB|nr:hypothetical protein FSP39_008322 [Pinctada imbricata]
MTQDEIENAGWMEMSKYPPETQLNFTPPVPRYSVSDVVYRLKDGIMERNLALDRRKYENHSIVILTPIHNSERHLVQFGELISGLDYPKSKISVVFGEDSSKDETLTMADHVLKALKKEGFRRTEVHHFNITGQVGDGWENKHRRISQYRRRRHLANARNLLMKAGLKDEEYALWIDVDIGYLPSDLIQQMIFTNKDVVTPCCLYRKQNQIRIYDKNTWRETKISLSEQEKLPKNAVIVEGYGPTTRIFLPHLQGEGRAVPLDGVGGCSLLVRAECHRKGLDFPETPYRRHIETEGLAKKATDLGFTVYGLPFLHVFHR